MFATTAQDLLPFAPQREGAGTLFFSRHLLMQGDIPFHPASCPAMPGQPSRLSDRGLPSGEVFTG